MTSTIEVARDILHTLAPEIAVEEITETTDLEADLQLDPLTKYALAFRLERALKVTIPDSRIEQAKTILALIAED
ncbi:acyl carrier protein [Flaviflexus massiliensis]|uniref:acyl carrier protein n=1 Tax=Flaviflexus massiliensis TaxID=1522309 RepID=UPI0006D562C2|nr:phosphopantetheine-binding protein [Flaviflexus massiliensis]